MIWQCIWILLSGRLVSPLNVVIKPHQSDEHTLKQLWTSTGFSPPKPHQAFNEYVHSDDFIQNIKLIGSLPYEPGRFQVRIHWLLDLVKVSTSKMSAKFDFIALDYLIQLLYQNGLSIGFELMGNPSGYFTDFEDTAQVNLWSQLIQQIGRFQYEYNILDSQSKWEAILYY